MPAVDPLTDLMVRFDTDHTLLADLQVGVKPCEIGVEIIDAIERNRVGFVPFWSDQSRSFDQGTRRWRTRMARPRFVRPSQLGDRLDRPNDR